jgi:ABC-type branched-subunit amino acid transport system ATPase component
MKLLQANGIVSGYGDMMVLFGASLYAEENEIVTIIGPNGCGKSTLLKTIMGYVRVREGEVLFEDQVITDLLPHERTQKGIGYVPQLDNVFSDLSIEENLEMGGYILDAAKLRANKEMVFDLFPVLGERKKLRAKTLSGGQKQMLAMGIALMHDPRIMLLDEPSAGLSPLMSEFVFEKIGDLNRLGNAIVIVEQDAIRSLAISDRAYVIAMGENKLTGKAADILKDPAIREAYLGEVPCSDGS